MKILLIQPAKPPVSLAGDDVHLFEPLALEYLAAPLIPRHDVRILDMRLDRHLDAHLATFEPDIIGITAYTVHVKTVKNLCESIKRWNPRALTVVGGHHATVAPQDFFSPMIDVVVMGEGVSSFEQIVHNFETGKNLAGIRGVAFRNGDDSVHSDPAPIAALDAFPFPVRGLTARYRKEYNSEWMKPLASIRTSKGCPFRCSFCALWKIAERRYLKRDPARLVEELGGIEEEFVFFADDESLVDAKRMNVLAGLIRAAGLKKRYFLYGRSDTIARNPRLLESWRKVGLERVFVGLEFFRDDDLAYVRKRSTTGDNDEAVRILKDLGVEIYASFIIRPEFTRDDFAELRRYCCGLRLKFASFAVLTPLPGTELHDEVVERMITHDYDLFDLIHTLLPTTLPLKEFYRQYYKLYRGSVSFRDGISLLRKFPAKELPTVLGKSFRWYRKLKAAYKDYGSLARA